MAITGGPVINMRVNQLLVSGLIAEKYFTSLSRHRVKMSDNITGQSFWYKQE